MHLVELVFLCFSLTAHRVLYKKQLPQFFKPPAAGDATGRITNADAEVKEDKSLGGERRAGDNVRANTVLRDRGRHDSLEQEGRGSKDKVGLEVADGNEHTVMEAQKEGVGTAALEFREGDREAGKRGDSASVIKLEAGQPWRSVRFMRPVIVLCAAFILGAVVALAARQALWKYTQQ